MMFSVSRSDLQAKAVCLLATPLLQALLIGDCRLPGSGLADCLWSLKSRWLKKTIPVISCDLPVLPVTPPRCQSVSGCEQQVEPPD
jgi:hypothetical protein